MKEHMDPLEELVRSISEGKIITKEQLQKEKFKVCGRYDLSELPGNAELIETAKRMDDIDWNSVKEILQRKPSRKASGVSVIAVMTSPAECPHGKCMVCPGGPDSPEPSPQSYTGREPAALRGARNEFSPYAQVKDRLEQYRAIGHKTDKVDLIIMGGTFPSRDIDYQHGFVKGCLDALNGFRSTSLEGAIRSNEIAPNRCIGLTVETRPDNCGEKVLHQMLSYGTTRVELGVQSLDDDTLKRIDRGHLTKDSIRATESCKDYGLKVCYHMMPGLPGTSKEEDLENFKMIFEDDRFRPDMLKIYPTLVVKGTELYDLWKEGKYVPLDTQHAAELVAEIKTIVPPYVRIQRVQRDIPSPLVEAGVKKSNLRQYAWKVMKEKGESCGCIRCREAGLSDKTVETEDLRLKELTYHASGGVEYFLEIGNEDLLVAYARLRIKDGISPTLRELKVVGEMTPLDSEPSSYQHAGYGSELLMRCEEIAGEFHDQIRVTSGIGVREYYRNHDYEMDGYYMVKDLP